MLYVLNNTIDNMALYSTIELFKQNKQYLNLALKYYNSWLETQPHVIQENPFLKNYSVNAEILERLTTDYEKPFFGIDSVPVDNIYNTIEEEIIIEKDFCNLLHFKKSGDAIQPKLLIVAPMSGHYATLLRGTVRDTLEHFDVYITDWTNARDIPLSTGNFDLDNYIDYVKEFSIHIGKNLSIMAVCQPTVPVLAAVSLLNEEGNDYIKNMILIGGPVDARVSTTEVNKFAENRPLNWFESNVITRVPMNYPGFMRPVYPGFIQLAGFMSMNMKRHVGQFTKLYQHLIEGDDESVESHDKFYDEYLSVMDIPAEFYLQTIETVFKKFSLPKGEMMHRDVLVRPEKIKNTALLVIEGELDDISGIGQTKAAITLCKSIPKSKIHYHLQEKVGHYGTFNGKKFKNNILPVIVKFCYDNLKTKK